MNGFRICAATLVVQAFHEQAEMKWKERHRVLSVIWPVISTLERDASREYDAQPEARAAGMPADERSHACIFRAVQMSTRGGIAGPVLARFEGRHRRWKCPACSRPGSQRWPYHQSQPGDGRGRSQPAGAYDPVHWPGGHEPVYTSITSQKAGRRAEQAGDLRFPLLAEREHPLPRRGFPAWMCGRTRGWFPAGGPGHLPNEMPGAACLGRRAQAASVAYLRLHTNIDSSQPKQLFKLQRLLKGDAKISGSNTLMTAEVDTHSSLNAGKPISAMTPDLFREFQWSAAAGTLVQTAFPGIFPDLTRYQAEADQTQVDQGHDLWKNDAAKVAQALEATFFHWQQPVSATVVSGGGPQDVDATVQLREAPGPDALVPVPAVTVKLSRFEGKTHNIWEVTAVEGTSLLTLTSLNPRALLASPVRVDGMGTTYGAFEGVIGQVTVFDHLYTDIGHARVIGHEGMGKTSYSTMVSYTSSFSTGVQEGLVAVYEVNGGTNDEIADAVMVKVLLSAS